VVFKRRNPRSWLSATRNLVYPDGGFRRATQYMIHRMRRLPDEPHKIARGVFAGTFVNFPPIFGIQFVTAALFAWVIRGNILAALLCTFLSNPITTPLIAVGALELGHWMLGIEVPLTPVMIFDAFSQAGLELWRNFLSMFSHETARWESLARFWQTIYFPYLVGSILPGLVVSVIAYYVTIPLVRAYQKLRATKTREAIEKRRRVKAALLELRALEEAEAKMRTAAGHSGDDGKANSS